MDMPAVQELPCANWSVIEVHTVRGMPSASCLSRCMIVGEPHPAAVCAENAGVIYFQ